MSLLKNILSFICSGGPQPTVAPVRIPEIPPVRTGTAIQELESLPNKSDASALVREIMDTTTDYRDILKVIDRCMCPGNHNQWLRTDLDADYKLLVWQKLVALINSFTAANTTLKLHARNLPEEVKLELRKKAVGMAITLDEIIETETFYRDNLLESVRMQKMNMLAQAALKAASDLGEILDVWSKIPHGCAARSASLASFPGWFKNGDMQISRIFYALQKFPEGTAAWNDLDAKLLEMSKKLTEGITELYQFPNKCAYIHTDEKAAYEKRWDALARKEIAAITTVDDAQSVHSDSRPGSDEETLAEQRWNELSMAAVTAAETFALCMNAMYGAFKGSEAKEAGVKKCAELAKTEREIREVWELGGLNPEIRTALTAKMHAQMA